MLSVPPLGRLACVSHQARVGKNSCQVMQTVAPSSAGFRWEEIYQAPLHKLSLCFFGGIWFKIFSERGPSRLVPTP